MFGYATDETDECMPLTVVLAHKLNQKIAELRRAGTFWWARPDTKTQVIIYSMRTQQEYGISVANDVLTKDYLLLLSDDDAKI